MSDRFMIAAPASGSGKTTVTCALLAALVSLGKDTVAFKCGPDYIDPMFHKKVTGVDSRNLDIFLMGEAGVRYSVAHRSAGKDIAVFEGVMGLYDGLGSSTYSSSNHVSVLTDTPVLLVLSPKGMAASVCATVKGFRSLEDNRIRGVLLNNVNETQFRFYKQMIEERAGTKVIGYMPHVPEAQIESRHLGLVTADEIAGIREKIEALGQQALRSIDFDALFALAAQAGPFDYNRDFLPSAAQEGDVKVYVASDEAFSFWYEDNHDLLKSLGAEIAFFSPLHDEELPGDADGLILWGGYPELHGTALANNTGMRDSLRRAIKAGLPVYAECGGFLYLHESLTDMQGGPHEMLGILPARAHMTPKLQNLGYYELKALRDNALSKKGERINAHFFHYSTSDFVGDCFKAVKQNGKTITCIASEANLLAGYQHLHFWGNPRFAGNFLQTCSEYRVSRKGGTT